MVLDLEGAGLGVVSMGAMRHWKHELRDWHRREHATDRWDHARPELRDDRDDRHGHRGRHRHHWHHGPPLPLLILFFVFAATHMATILGAVFLATITVALIVGAVLLARYGATEGMRYLASRRSRSRAGRIAAHRAAPHRRLAPAAGPTSYREQLLDVLKDRYVRGEIALAEFEERVTQVVRDPSAKHLG